MEAASGSPVGSDLTAGVSRNGPDSIIKGVRKLQERQTRHLITLKMNSTASKSGLTRQQKIKVLGQDFLDRDQDRYVKIRRSGRLGWESLIPQGGNYSDLLRNCHGEGDIIKEAYGIARDYIVAMDTPYRVTLRLSPEQNCTDSRVVYLATRVFDDKDLSEGQKIDTFVGLAIHEGCHLKWTDFSQLGEASNGIIRNLINLLEDERIERLCGEHMPGYANYLKATKYYMFDLYASKMLTRSKNAELPAPVRLLNAILALIRYPKSLNADDLDEFADYLYDVRSILEHFPQTKEEVSAAAEAIYEVIRRFFEQQEQKKRGSGGGQPEQSSSEEKTEDNEEGEGSSDEERGDDTDGDDSSPAGSEEQEDEGKDGGKSGSEDGTEGQGADAEGSSDGQDESIEEAVRQALEELEEETSDAMSQLTSDASEGSQPMESEDMASCVKKDDCQLAGICENSITLGLSSHSVLYKAPEGKETYDESLKRVRKYIPAIAKSLRDHCREYQVTYRGMRSGLLDTSKLAEAFQGVQNVYIREGQVKSDRMAVCVLIDESGSMYGEKITAARDVAVLLNEAVATVPGIDLYIYGHTYGDRCRDSYRAGDQITELQLYREKGYAPKKSLGSIEARSGNLDSFAIREASARMLKFSSCRQNLMFVITDGAPNERYEQLTTTVKTLEKQGMNIVAVCIEPSYDPSQLYTHSVTLTDMNTLALELGKMIKKAILKNARRHEE